MLNASPWFREGYRVSQDMSETLGRINNSRGSRTRNVIPEAVFTMVRERLSENEPLRAKVTDYRSANSRTGSYIS